MSIAMYLENSEWVVVEEDPQKLKCGICPGLPKQRIPNKEWKHFYDLHQFMMTCQSCFFLMEKGDSKKLETCHHNEREALHQCHTLTGPLASNERLLNRRHHNDLMELYPNET